MNELISAAHDSDREGLAPQLDNALLEISEVPIYDYITKDSDNHGHSGSFGVWRLRNQTSEHQARGRPERSGTLGCCHSCGAAGSKRCGACARQPDHFPKSTGAALACRAAE